MIVCNIEAYLPAAPAGSDEDENAQSSKIARIYGDVDNGGLLVIAGFGLHMAVKPSIFGLRGGEWRAIHLRQSMATTHGIVIDARNITGMKIRRAQKRPAWSDGRELEEVVIHLGRDTITFDAAAALSVDGLLAQLRYIQRRIDRKENLSSFISAPHRSRFTPHRSGLMLRRVGFAAILALAFIGAGSLLMVADNLLSAEGEDIAYMDDHVHDEAPQVSAIPAPSSAPVGIGRAVAGATPQVIRRADEAPASHWNAFGLSTGGTQ